MKIPTILRYDGRYSFVDWTDNRSYTIMSNFIDSTGANRIGSTFMWQALKDLGVIP